MGHRLLHTSRHAQLEGAVIPVQFSQECASPCQTSTLKVVNTCNFDYTATTVAAAATALSYIFFLGSGAGWTSATKAGKKEKLDWVPGRAITVNGFVRCHAPACCSLVKT